MHSIDKTKMPLRLIATLKARHCCCKQSKAVLGRSGGDVAVTDGIVESSDGSEDSTENSTIVSNISDDDDDDDDGQESAGYMNFSAWRELILDCCTLVDRDLRMLPGNMDCFCSGTTALLVLKQVSIKD
jgi:hypothetical protein